MTKRKVLYVVYKDEGDFGFITIVREGDEPGRPVPYDPDRQRPYGTLKDAEALAREHGVEVRMS